MATLQKLNPNSLFYTSFFQFFYVLDEKISCRAKKFAPLTTLEIFARQVFFKTGISAGRYGVPSSWKMSWNQTSGSRPLT